METATKGEIVRGGLPIFLIGPPRSGTTLLARVLNSHQKILLTNETAVFMQLANDIEKSRMGSKAGILYGKQYHELWASVLEKNAHELFASYYDSIADYEGKDALSYWGEKHPHLSMCLPSLEALYPSATYVYSIRDPRDTACSLAQMNGVSFDDALKNWVRFSTKYEPFVGRQPAESVVTVRYEDMVADYFGVTEKVLSGLGLVVEEDVRQFLEQYKDVDSHRLEAFRLNPFKKRRFADSSVGRWRRELRRDECIKADSLVGGFLDKYGYERFQ